MWKIIKAQFNYNKMVLIFCFLISMAVIIPFFIQGWKVVEKSYPAVRAVLFAMTALIFLSSSIKDVKEKRDRFLHTLPCNLWKFGTARLIFVIIFWTILLILVLLAFLLRKSIFNITLLNDFLSQTGFIIFMICIVFFVRDIGFVFKFKNRKIFLGILNFVIIVVAYVIFMLFVASREAMDISPSLIPIKNNFSEFIMTSSGAAFFLALGSTMFFISNFIFSKRKTYIE